MQLQPIIILYSPTILHLETTKKERVKLILLSSLRGLKLAPRTKLKPIQNRQIDNRSQNLFCKDVDQRFCRLKITFHCFVKQKKRYKWQNRKCGSNLELNFLFKEGLDDPVCVLFFSFKVCFFSKGQLRFNLSSLDSLRLRKMFLIDR